MKKTFIAVVGIFCVPTIALAAQASIQSLLVSVARLINSSVVPFLFALAFLFFIFNVARYFIIGSGNEDARKKARTLALWSIIAFVVMVSIWGIVNLLLTGLGSYGRRNVPVCPDFFPLGECYKLDLPPEY